MPEASRLKALPIAVLPGAKTLKALAKPGTAVHGGTQAQAPAGPPTGAAKTSGGQCEHSKYAHPLRHE